jgi:hypothetical protein
MEGMNSIMIYFKNFYKCHMYPPCIINKYIYYYNNNKNKIKYFIHKKRAVIGILNIVTSLSFLLNGS